MIVDDLDIIGVTVAETKAYPPWPIDRDRPLASSAAFERMQAYAFESGNFIEPGDRIQFSQTAQRSGNIETTHGRSAGVEQSSARAVAPASDRHA